MLKQAASLETFKTDVDPTPKKDGPNVFNIKSSFPEEDKFPENIPITKLTKDVDEIMVNMRTKAAK